MWPNSHTGNSITLVDLAPDCHEEGGGGSGGRVLFLLCTGNPRRRTRQIQSMPQTVRQQDTRVSKSEPSIKPAKEPTIHQPGNMLILSIQSSQFPVWLLPAQPTDRVSDMSLFEDRPTPSGSSVYDKTFLTYAKEDICGPQTTLKTWKATVGTQAEIFLERKLSHPSPGPSTMAYKHKASTRLIARTERTTMKLTTVVA